MKIKTSELSGSALDWAAAAAVIDDTPQPEKGLLIHQYGYGASVPPYSTDWSQGGPIIEREKIEIVRGNPLYFPKGNENGDFYEPLWIAGKQHGQTPLIAAMRCYVASKLGDEVDVPETLL